ncbi:MAG TPA: helix-turn-helix transcriptional regulator [Aestuariivirga sp.]|nr:helix-turn-helix transcriptional regulator [Aestuariivirga sp.]
MTKGLSPYEVFADNLFELATQYGSIAAVCRDSGINRQQFNKYLAGKTLPGPDTLSRLALFFKVAEMDLFRPALAASVTSGREARELPQEFLSQLASNITGARPVRLREGVYLAYFPAVMGKLHAVARSCIVLKNQDGILGFTRFSHSASRAGQGEIGMRGYNNCHTGIAVEIDGRSYFIGKCRSGHQEVSLLTLGPHVFHAKGLMTGLGLTISSWGEPVASRIVLQYFGPLSTTRKALRLVGRFPIDSAEVPADLRPALMPSDRGHDPPFLLPVDLSSAYLNLAGMVDAASAVDPPRIDLATSGE